MDYQKHYNLLIERAKSRVLTGYVERHHIIPRCMGGGEDMGNLVQLTAEEHYVAHQLLHKISPDSPPLMFAIIAMAGNPIGKRGNKVYGWMRKKNAMFQSINSIDRWADPEYREKHKKAMARLWANPEAMTRISAAVSQRHKGRIKSEQERANIAEAGRNRTPRKFSEQAKLNMAEARRKTWEQRKLSGEDKVIAAKIKATRIANGSYNFSEEHKKAIGEAGKGRIPWNKGKKLKPKQA